PGTFFGLVPGAGAGGVGVYLQGEGSLGRQVFEQGGQAGPETFHGFATEYTVGVLGDQSGQGLVAVVTVDDAGCSVAGTRPQLGLWGAVRVDPQQMRDGSACSPDVRTYPVRELVHPSPAFPP